MRDPAASLSLFPIELELAGRVVTVPPLGAGWWVGMLMANDLAMLVAAEPEGALDDKQAREIECLLIDGDLSMKQLRDALQDAVTVAAGRDWWEAVGLIHTFAAEVNWARLHGQMVMAGMDMEATPLGAWLDVAFHVATRNMDEKQMLRFTGMLQTPPVEVGLDEEREGAAFLAMLGAG